MITVKFKDDALRNLRKDLDSWTNVRVKPRVSSAVEDTLRSIASIARSRVSVATGALKASIRWQMVTTLSGEAGTNVDYAPHLEFGTKPHVIVPRRRQILRWRTKDGEVVFARRVNHPGTDPKPFLEPAARMEEVRFPQRIAFAVGGA